MVKLDNPTQFIPSNGKIMDINEDDTDSHTCSISAYIPPNCTAIILNAVRTSGTGHLTIWPNEGTYNVRMSSALHQTVIAIKNMGQRLKYKQTVANDVFELYFMGYWIEGEIKT